MRSFAVHFAVSVLLCAACSEDRCTEQSEEIAGCGLRFRDNVCESTAGECAIACYAKVDCATLRSAVFDDVPHSEGASRCLQQCVEPFRCDDGATVIDASWQCDGEADCRDGADEPGRCDYFECDDGQLVREDARCDEWEECRDGSDEEGC